MKLLIKEGPNSGQELDLEGSSVVGRDPASATLVVEDPEASRRHASLAPSGTGVTVEDLGSTNGTYVNGERVQGSREAAAGDEIRIGNTVLVVQGAVDVTRVGGFPEPPPAPPMGGPPPAGPPLGAPPPITPPPITPPPGGPPPGGPPPPPGAGQGYGAPPQQAYQQGPPPMGQPGGPMVGYGGSPVNTRESVVEWLLCAFIPFYNIFWIHRASKEMQAFSGGRIGYSPGSTIAALTIGAFVFIPVLVAIFSFGGRLRRAQEIAGVQPRASGIGFFGRLLLLGYGYKWAQDQLNEIAVRQPQG